MFVAVYFEANPSNQLTNLDKILDLLVSHKIDKFNITEELNSMTYKIIFGSHLYKYMISNCV